MDASAFLALPASDFPIPPDSLPEVAEHNGDATEGGVFSHHAHAPEGERRRKEMLAVACSLEERYRTLLNPDKKSSGKRFTRVESAIIEHALAESVSDAEEGEEEVEETEEEEEEEEVDELEEEEVEDEPPSPRRPSYHDESGESEVDEEERDRRRSKGLKLKIKFSVRTPPQTKGTLPKPTKKKKQTQTTLSPFMSKPAKGAAVLNQKVDDERLQSPTKGPPTTTSSSFLTTASAPPRARGPTGRYLPKGKGHDSPSPAKGPPKKRPRTDSLVSFTHPPAGKMVTIHSESISMAAMRPMRLDSPGSRQYATYAGAAGKPEQTTCVLMVAALRNSAAPNVRKTQRNVLAFGARVPPEIELVRDFEIPEWVFDQEAQDDDPSVDQNGGSSIYRSLSRDFKQESVTSAALASRQASVDDVASPEG